MYLAVMVGKFVKQVVREWCPSTIGPLLPTITDSLLAPSQEELYKKGPSSESIFTFSHEAGPQQGLLLSKVLIGGLHCIVL